MSPRPPSILYADIFGQTGISAGVELSMVSNIIYYVPNSLKDLAEVYVNLLSAVQCGHFSTKLFDFLAVLRFVAYTELQSLPLRQMWDGTVLAMYDAVDGFKRWGEDI